jgi:hypothetical protein
MLQPRASRSKGPRLSSSDPSRESSLSPSSAVCRSTPGSVLFKKSLEVDFFGRTRRTEQIALHLIQMLPATFTPGGQRFAVSQAVRRTMTEQIYARAAKTAAIGRQLL